MAARFTPTTFATKANEALLTVDAYAVQTARGTRTSVPDINSVLNLNAYSGMRGGAPGLNLNYFNKAKGFGFQVNADALLKGIIAQTPGLSGALSQMSPGLRSNVLSQSGLSSISVTAVGGLKSIVAGANLSDLTAVGGMISGLTGVNFGVTFMDMKGLTSLTTNLTLQAANLGIPNAFSSLSVGVNMSSVMGQVTRNLAGPLIRNSNVNLLMNITSSPYARQLTAQRPSFINDFSSNYRMPSSTREREYLPTLNNIDSSFQKLDTDWTRADADSVDALNLSCVNDASVDYQKLLDANIAHANVPVPVAEDTDYSQIDTSLGNARNSIPDIDWNVDLAAAEGMRAAMPEEDMAKLRDTGACLRDDYPYVASENW